MSKRKPPQSPNPSDVSLTRSSAAEYLTFIAASGQGGVEAIYADESIWITQKMMGALYDVNVRTVNEHLKKVFADSELEADSVIRKFRITAAEIAKAHAESEFKKYRIVQDRLFESDFDRMLKQIETDSAPDGNEG